jgi:hypothetical protein
MAGSYDVQAKLPDGIIPVDGTESWVTVKLPDGIILVDGRIPVDGGESWVKIKLSRWLCKNHDS